MYYCYWYANYEILNEKITKLLENSNYETIIFTKFKNDRTKNSFYQDKIHWYKLQKEEEQEFSVPVPKDAIIFEKYTYGLSREQLDKIKSLGYDEIDVCGLQASSCVDAISFQLFDMGIFPNILANFVESEEGFRDTMIKTYVWNFGSVDNTYFSID